VRVGNSAAGQYQLDVWGEVLDGLYLSRRAGLSSDDDAWELQTALLDFLEGHWDEPDNGLWEVRGPRRHFVHSKVQAWAGVDRMVRTAQGWRADAPLDRWRALGDAIHADVCARGFDATRGTFTQYYGGTGVDAALLLIPRVGFLPWDDERVAGTVAAVQQDLYPDGFVRRYRTEDGVDGLPGSEGAFLACSFWLADALAGLGRKDEAVELFERLLSLRNDVGLLAEEWDPQGARQVGNVPQAFSHVALVNTARQLSGDVQATTSHGPDGERATR
jgi:GH15 family glucan-1,4-alpha-glucosidase